MDEWAIEAQNLVKKFPRKSQNGEGKNGAKAKSTWRSRLRFLNRDKKKNDSEGFFFAVNGVSLQIQRGEVFGLLGPNGAGKSTTIRMLCTLLEPTSGTALVNGYDILKQPNQVRQSLGTVLVNPP